MCGRVSRITAMRSGMVAASKATKITTVTMSSSRESPPPTPLASDCAGPARLLSCTDFDSWVIWSWPNPHWLANPSSESKIWLKASAYCGSRSTSRATAKATEPRIRINSP